jgi:hypothetical protein
LRDPDTDAIAASRFLTIKEFSQLIMFLLHHTLEQFLHKQLVIGASTKLNARSRKAKVELDITFHVEGEDTHRHSTVPIAQQLAFNCQQRGLLSEHDTPFEGYTALYKYVCKSLT